MSLWYQELIVAENLSLLKFSLYLEKEVVVCVVQLMSVLQHHLDTKPVGALIKLLKRMHSLLAFCAHPVSATNPLKQLSKQGPSKADTRGINKISCMINSKYCSALVIKFG